MELKFRYYKDIILDMHDKGYSSLQMEKEIPVTHDIIQKWLLRLNKSDNPFNNNINSNCHNIEFTDEDYIKAYNTSTSDIEIANKLKISRRASSRIRARLSLPKLSISGRRTPTEKIIADSFQHSMLIGCMLGDGYLNKKDSHNATGTIAHSVKQKDYIEYKHLKLRSLVSKLSTCIYHAKGVEYPGLRFNFISNPYITTLYDMLYIPNKTITSDLLLHYNEISLAFHFMDDGSKARNGYRIHTDGFDKDSVYLLSKHLRKKFNLQTTVQSTKRLNNTYYIIYIKKDSIKLFNSIVSEYIIPSMEYKLHLPSRNASLKNLVNCWKLR